jgi:predicted DNA-binding transcriptional regulator YafY
LSYHATLKKYILIVEKLQKKTYPSINDIIDSLSRRDLPSSKRTIERAIETLRDDFGVGIAYDKRRRGYYINEEESLDFTNFIGFLKHSHSAKFLIETLRDGHDALKYIHFDSTTNLLGGQYLQELLEAIKNTQVVNMSYQAFDNKPKNSFNFHPELLKEYMNRWYVMGFADYANEQRIYALDRITNLFVTSAGFKKQLGDADEVFGDIIGVNYSGEKIIEIILSFTPSQGNYIRNFPIHRSQQIIIDDETELQVAIYVKPNFELKQKIQMYGSEVEVIKPVGLLESIK